MPSHPEFTHAFRAGLATGALPPGLTARDPTEAARRFAVYRNNVAHSLAEALARRFPAVERLVGRDFFRAMARAFVAEHPPRSPVLLAWGPAFPTFLEGFAPARGLPYLGDVARLELARGEAYHAADRAPLGPEALAAAAADPGVARLALHPSVRLLASRFAVVSIWRASATGERVRADRPEAALILRDRSGEVAAEALAPGEVALVAALLRGASLRDATAEAVGVEAGHNPGPVLARLARAGALVAPEARS